MSTSDDLPRSIRIITIPTREELLPPPAHTLLTEMIQLQRAPGVWEMVETYVRSIDGEKASLHGSRDADEYALVFQLQAKAKENGFIELGQQDAASIKRLNRLAYRHNTGTRWRELIAQNKLIKRLGGPSALHLNEPKPEQPDEPESDESSED